MRWLLLAALVAMPAVAGNDPFAVVVPGHPIEWPQDKGAHPAYRMEWWYATGWLQTTDHRQLGFQVTFFRTATGLAAKTGTTASAFEPSQLIMGHAALSDPAYGRVVYAQGMARQGFDLAYAKVGKTDVKLDAWRMTQQPDGRYEVVAESGNFSLHLMLAPTQPPMIQGDLGYSRKGPEQASYYYSEPQLKVTGEVSRPSAAGGRSASVTVTGQAWLDHEWTSAIEPAGAQGWDWLGANLDDGGALMAFRVRAKDGSALWTHAALRDREGRMTQFDPADVDFMPARQWRSPHTGARYPVAMSVRTGTMHWRLEPLIDDQELDTRDTSHVVYWEGPVTVMGDDAGGGRRGRGYLELVGYANAPEP